MSLLGLQITSWQWLAPQPKLSRSTMLLNSFVSKYILILSNDCAQNKKKNLDWIYDSFHFNLFKIFFCCPEVENNILNVEEVTQVFE